MEASRPNKRKWDVGPQADAVPGPTGQTDGVYGSPSFAEALSAVQAAAPQAVAYGAPLPADPAPAAAQLEPFVRLRGLPFSAGEPEIRAFLGGLGVEAVRFCLGPTGRVNGEAVVALASVEIAASALQRNRTYLGHRYVEVYPATADEFGYAPSDGLATGPATQGPVGTVLRMRGLPFSASMQEIARFWAGYGLYRVAQVPLGADGRPSGEAYVEFTSFEEAGRALSSMQRSLMGNRYVELYPAPHEEMISRAGEGRLVQAVLTEQQVPLASHGLPPASGHYNPAGTYAGGGAGPAAEHGSTGVLRLRGLPYQATAADIQRFFQGFGISRIMPTTAPQHGRPSGEAYVEFFSPAESSRALHERQRCLLGQRYVELFHSPPQEMASQVALGQGIVEVAHSGTLRESGSGGLSRHAGPHRGSRPPLPAARPEGDPGVVMLMRGLPYQATVEDVVSFFAGCGVARVLPTIGPGGRATGEAYVEFGTAQQCDAALASHQHGHIGQRYIELFPAPLSDWQAAEAALKTHEAAPNGAAAAPAGGYSQQQNAPSPVLMMRGLPFAATTNDINNFFRGFTLAKILPVMPEGGQPNKGDAYVQFASAQECSRALQECQHHYVGNRYIKLFSATAEEMRRACARNAEADRMYAQQSQQAQRPQQTQWHGHNEGMGRTGESSILRMRGLPFEATPEDIVNFFDGFKPLRVMPSAASYGGRPSGEAYVEFATTQDAEYARSLKHKAMLGARWIELYPASFEEFTHAARGREPLKAS